MAKDLEKLSGHQLATALLDWNDDNPFTFEDVIEEVGERADVTAHALASSLCARAEKLVPKVEENDEAAALAAVMLRALAAYTQAEQMRGLMAAPDLVEGLTQPGGGDETMPEDWPGEEFEDDGA